MITLEGEITEITSPPNKADRVREVAVWVPNLEEYIELTFPLEEFQKSGMETGDQITIKIDKKLDIDRDLHRFSVSVIHKEQSRQFRQVREMADDQYG